jgi:hypothetical protein
MSVYDQTWYSVTLQDLKLHRLRSWSEDDSIWEVYTFNPYVTVGRNPIVVGQQWQELISVTITDIQGTYTVPGVTVTSTVLYPEFIVIPSLGTYLAQKFQNVITIPLLGTITEIHWFVPYLGFIKAQVTSPEGTETATLTGMSFKKWLLNYENLDYTPLSAYHLPSNQFLSENLGNLGQYGWGLSDSMPLMWDYDGDGVADLSFYHIPSNQWFVKDKGIPGDNLGQFGWGGEACIPVPGDYDGDGVMERAFYHWPSNRWFVEGQEPVQFGYGGAASIPFAVDYDGDGKTDMMIYHVESNQWFVYGKGIPGDNLGQFGWGGANCIPVPGDWNGDGKTEIAVYYMPDNEWVWRDAAGTAHFMGKFGWGGSDSFPLAADGDGIGTFGRAIYRPLENRWIAEFGGSGGMYWGWGGADFMPVINQMAVYNWFRFRLGMFQ